jgi:hypothetical protein
MATATPDSASKVSAGARCLVTDDDVAGAA